MPRWSSDGRELIYRGPREFMAVRVSPTGPLAPQAPRLLFQRTILGWYDVLPGGRLVMFSEADVEGASEINVALNWFEHLKRIAPPVS